MIPARYGPMLFSLILSGTMSLLVSGIAAYRTLLSHQGFAGLWMSAWLTGWLFAFPAVVLAAPLARRAVAWLTGQRHAGAGSGTPERGRLEARLAKPQKPCVISVRPQAAYTRYSNNE